MKIKFIGTGSGKTSQNRFHTSILLDFGTILLIDAGDGISRALQYSQIDYSLIDSIIITHFHPDHISGLPMLLNQMKMNNRKKEINIYSYEKQKNKIKTLCDINLIFFDRLGFNVNLIPFSENQTFYISEKIKVIPRFNSHLDKLNKSNVRCFSLFIKPFNIHYTSDLNNIDDLDIFNEQKTEYLISECTHIHPKEIISKINFDKFNSLFLVHIDSEDDIKAWYNSLENMQKDKIFITYDGLEFEL